MVLAQIDLRLCLVFRSHNAARRAIALEARTGTGGCRDGGARLRSAVVSRGILYRLLRLLNLLNLLCSFVQLIQILAKRMVPLHALADMMAVRFMLDRSLMPSFRRRL